MSFEISLLDTLLLVAMDWMDDGDWRRLERWSLERGREDTHGL